EVPSAYRMHTQPRCRGEGTLELLPPRLDLAASIEDRVDRAIRALGVTEGFLECAAADRLARGVQVLEKRLQIDAHVRRGGEFLAGRREDSDDPLKLRLLGRLEPLLRELSRFPVRSFADRALGLREQVLRGRRVGAYRPRLLDDAQEIARAPFERSLESFLRFRAALAQRVLRLLEIVICDVSPGPLG